MHLTKNQDNNIQSNNLVQPAELQELQVSLAEGSQLKRITDLTTHQWNVILLGGWSWPETSVVTFYWEDPGLGLGFVICGSQIKDYSLWFGQATTMFQILILLTTYLYPYVTFLNVLDYRKCWEMGMPLKVFDKMLLLLWCCIYVTGLVDGGRVEDLFSVFEENESSVCSGC